MLSVAACDTIRDAYLPDAAIITEERKEVGGKPGPINLDTYRFTFIVEFPGAKPPSPPAEDPAPSPVGNDSGENGIVLRGPVTSGGTLAYHGAVMAQVVAVSSGDVANKRVAKVLRNMLQSKFRDRSDQVCDFHLAGILGYSATANFVTGLLATSLSALSAAFTGNAAKTALSTSAAIIGASRAEMNAQIFYNAVAPAVVREIRNSRIEAFKALEKLAEKSISEYSVDEMIRRVNEYHYKCSFMKGLVAVTKEKVVTPPTPEDIDNRILAIQEDNEGMKDRLTKLEKQFATAKGPAKRAIRQQVLSVKHALSINNARLAQLRTMRLSAPIKAGGEFVPSAVPETEESPPSGEE